MSVRILAFAYACEPGKGSEPGAGWGLARLLAREMGEVWVITRANNREAIEAAMPRIPEGARLKFVYVDLPLWAMFWKRGQRGVRLYYLLWLFAALRKARQLEREVGFDLVWHLTLANAWLGTTAALVGPRFVYGPVGGGVGAPWRLLPLLGARGAMYEVVRALARAVGRYLNPLARVAWWRAELILVQNPETREWLPARYRGKAVIFPNAVAAEVEYFPVRPPRDDRRPPTALFAGRLLPLKGVALGLRAIARLPEWRFIVIGSGSDERRLRGLSRRLGLEGRVEFRAWQPREEVLRAMREEADVFLFPSLHDQAPWVIAEALGSGLPVVCLDRGGPPVVARIVGAEQRTPSFAEPLALALATVSGVASLAFAAPAVAGALNPMTDATPAAGEPSADRAPELLSVLRALCKPGMGVPSWHASVETRMDPIPAGRLGRPSAANQGAGASMGAGRRLLAGGVVMGVRELVAMGLSAIGAIIVIRLLGPENYGVVTAVLVVSTLLGRLGTLGLDSYLTRYPGPVPEEVVRTVAVACFGLAIAAGITLAVLSEPIAAAVGIAASAPVLAFVAPALVLGLAARVPTALLEHDLKFRDVASAELLGMLTYHFTTVPLAYLGLRYWAVAIGSVVQGCVTAGLLFRLARIPVGSVNLTRLREAFQYGWRFQLSQAVWLTRDLVGPAILARGVGPAAVGALGAARLLAQKASFPQTVMWRIGFPGMAHLGTSSQRKNVTAQAMRMQAVGLGATLLVASLVMPWLFPIVAGESWLPATRIFTFLACAIYVNGLFILHSSALFVDGRFIPLNVFHLANIGTLAAAAAILVPRMGLVGYGVAELVPAWSYILLHLLARRRLGGPSYRRVWPAACTFGSALVMLGLLTDPVLRVAIAFAALAVGAVLSGPDLVSAVRSMWRAYGDAA